MSSARRRRAQPAQDLAAARSPGPGRRPLSAGALGDYRLALLFGGIAGAPLGASSTGTPTGSRWGWSARASSWPREAPAAASDRRPARAARRRRQAAPLPDPRRLPARAQRRPWRPGRSGARPLLGPARASRRRPSSRGSSRTSSRTSATATCSCRRWRSSSRSRSSRPHASAGAFQRALLFVLGPLAASIEHLLLSPNREFEADRLAAELCGSPHGLADALLRLEQSMGLVVLPGQPGDRAALHRQPLRRGGPGDAVCHPPAARRARAQRLRALDPDWREKLRAA